MEPRVSGRRPCGISDRRG